MKYNGIIQRKLAFLSKQYLQLRTHTQDLSYTEFEDNWVLRSMTERALQVMVEIMIDIAERILALEGLGPASSASEAMKMLAELGVLKSDEPYSSMVRFRNLIVHQYEAIEPALMYDILQNKLNYFLDFRDEIDRS